MSATAPAQVTTVRPSAYTGPTRNGGNPNSPNAATTAPRRPRCWDPRAGAARSCPSWTSSPARARPAVRRSTRRWAPGASAPASRATLQYETYFNDDESEAMVLERYRDSQALIDHGQNMAHRMEPIIATATVTGELLGELSPELRALTKGDVPAFSRRASCRSSPHLRPDADDEQERQVRLRRRPQRNGDWPRFSEAPTAAAPGRSQAESLRQILKRHRTVGISPSSPRRRASHKPRCAAASCGHRVQGNWR